MAFGMLAQCRLSERNRAKVAQKDGDCVKPSELLARPESWTQGDFSRDKEGRSARSRPEEQCSWCLMGALMKCYPQFSSRMVITDLLRDKAGCASLSYWNDAPERTHAEVLALLKEVGL